MLRRPDSQNRPPASRYFLARFKTFAKPKFWVAGLALIGLLAFAWELSQRPDWRQALTKGQPENMTPEEKEDQAIGADLDSLPLLSADLNPKKQPQPNQNSSLNTGDPLEQLKLTQQSDSNNGKPNPAKSSDDSLAKLFGGGSSTPSATLIGLDSSSYNPWLNASNAGSNSNPSSMPSGSLLNGMNGSNRSDFASNSQLSQALNRYSPASPNPNAPVPVNPSEPTMNQLGTAGLSQYAPIQGNAPINAPTYNNLPPLAGSTNVNPAGNVPGTGMNSFTGLTSGSVPDTVAVPGFGSAGVVSPGQTSIPVSPGSTPLPPGTDIGVPISPSRSTTLESTPDLPFTAPRSIPGRSIGGGEINTFSNP